jgi:hypothetical protein
MLDENRYIRNRTTFKTALKYILLKCHWWNRTITSCS